MPLDSVIATTRARRRARTGTWWPWRWPGRHAPGRAIACSESVSASELFFRAHADAHHRSTAAFTGQVPAADSATASPVGAVDDRVGHVQHLARVGMGAVHHRLQHLGGGDHDLLARHRFADDLLFCRPGNAASPISRRDCHAPPSPRRWHRRFRRGSRSPSARSIFATNPALQPCAPATRRASCMSLGIAAERHRDEVRPCRRQWAISSR